MSPFPESNVVTGKARWRRAAIEVVGLLVAFLLFARVHAAVGTDIGVATANALRLQSWERALHLDIELAANRWLVVHPALIQPAVYYYRLYYAVLVGVLLWVYVRHADVYPRIRRTLIAMLVLVLPVFWALPMSPPRFASPGVVDIIAEHDILGGQATRDLGNGQNHISAMPSLHVGWSLLCAYAAWSALRGTHPRWALLAWLFPAGMTAVVFTTGNHYVLDVVGSVVLLVTAIALAAGWARLGERLRTMRRRNPPTTDR